MTIENLSRRYLNDTNFHYMVDNLQAIIMQLHLTPSEIREAAMFAAYLVESRKPVSLVVDKLNETMVDPLLRRR